MQMTTMRTIPATMQAMELRVFDGRADSLVAVQKPVPQPGPGQVLVQMQAATINPSDLVFLTGGYPVEKHLPVVAGFVGSGRVVASGDGDAERALLDRRVTLLSLSGDGTWAEYCCTPAALCVPLPDSISYEEGAFAIVNPLTALNLLRIAQERKVEAIVQTAAASDLGRMLLRLCKDAGLPVINVVRRQEQIDLLQDEGAEYLLNSTSPDFERDLRQYCRKLHATVAFDAVGGELTGQILAAMPAGSTIVVYGMLQDEPCRVPMRLFIFEQKRVEGFWLTDWFFTTDPAITAQAIGRALTLLPDECRTQIQARYPIVEANRAIEHYRANMTEGKVLLTANS